MGNAIFAIGFIVSIIGFISIIKPLKKLKIENRKTASIVFVFGFILFFAGGVIVGNNDKELAEKAGYTTVGEYRAAEKADEKRIADEKKAEQTRIAEEKKAEEARIAAAKVIQVNIQDILSAYESNEVGADNRFKGETIEVTGIVADIKKDILDNLYVLLGTGSRFEIPSIQAFFDDSMNSQLGQLNKGQRLTVVCRVDGLMMNVIAENCSIK